VRTRRRLTQARALVPTILDREAGSLSNGDGRLQVASADVTSTGMAIVVMANADRRPCLVIKVPLTSEAAEGLVRESRALASLHATERLGEWLDLIPRPVAQGTVGQRTYRVDAALAGTAPGASISHDPARQRLRAVAAETIHFLHRATETVTRVDAELAERWVDARLHDLWPRGPRSGRLRSKLERLEHELHGAVEGQTLRTGWVHGDFWLGNLLVSEGPGTISGIVDWDAAAPAELALHDVLHLLVYTRRMATGRELGRIVGDQLRGAPWAAHERQLLERYAVWCHDGALSERHALLLYWLRHASSHARQQGGRGGPRYRLWEVRNVHRVLAEL
jgi:aminoglycoside phosphotransferase (APT) family kinase protein